MPATNRKNTPRLRDGVIKRGSTWSYVIRVNDPETGISKQPSRTGKRPRAQAQEPGTVWTIAQLRAFLATAQQHRLFAFFHVAAYTGPAAASCSACGGRTSTSTARRSPSPARRP
jgi:hypothetical protein